MIEIVVIAIVVAICAAILASNKNRSGFGWFILTLIFPIAILILLCLGKLPKPGDEGYVPVKNMRSQLTSSSNQSLQQQTSPANTKVQDDMDPDAPVVPIERTCPYCAETIKTAATICKHCGKEVAPDPDYLAAKNARLVYDLDKQIKEVSDTISSIEARMSAKDYGQLYHSKSIFSGNGYMSFGKYFDKEEDAKAYNEEMLAKDKSELAELTNQLTELKEKLAEADGNATPHAPLPA